MKSEKDIEGVGRLEFAPAVLEAVEKGGGGEKGSSEKLTVNTSCLLVGGKGKE